MPVLQPGEVCVLLDDVRSLWNVGSVLRTADGLGLRHVYLCGITGLPTDKRVHASALGAERTVSWSYHQHPFAALHALRRQGAGIVVLERTEGARRLQDSESTRPLCLVVGNEPAGVSPEVIAIADECLELPALGSKSSLNVAVACGIAAWWLTTRSRPGAPASPLPGA